MSTTGGNPPAQHRSHICNANHRAEIRQRSAAVTSAIDAEFASAAPQSHLQLKGHPGGPRHIKRDFLSGQSTSPTDGGSPAPQKTGLRNFGMPSGLSKKMADMSMSILSLSDYLRGCPLSSGGYFRRR